MQAKAFRPHSGQTPERFRDLRAGHAIFGVAGVIHDLKALPALAQRKHAAGIIAAADRLRNLPDGFFQEIHQREIVQIDQRPQPPRLLKLFRGRVVGGKHNPLPRDAAALRHAQFRQGRTVAPAALIPQNLDNRGRGGGFHGEILPETGIPGKRAPQPPGVVPDAFLVVEVEGRRVTGGNGL